MVELKDIRKAFTQGQARQVVVKKPSKLAPLAVPSAPIAAPDPPITPVPPARGQGASVTIRPAGKQAQKYQDKLDRLFEDFPDPPAKGEKVVFSPEFEEWFRELDEEKRARLDRAIAENVRELNERPGGRFPAVAARTFTLSKATPRVTLIARPWEWSEWLSGKTRLGWRTPRLIVTGLGECAKGKSKKRLGIVDMTVLGFRDKFDDVGITCDGAMTLHDNATHVRLRLNDPKASVTVTIEEKPGQYSPAPPAWIARKLRKEGATDG